MIEGLWKFYLEGGIFMHPITFLMAVGYAVIIERFYVLFSKFNLNTEKYYQFVEDKLLEGDLDSAMSKHFNVPLSNILNFGIEKIKVYVCKNQPVCDVERVLKGERRAAIVIEKSIDEIAAIEFPKIDNRLSFLPMLANLSTLLGLLGTLQGLIQSFMSLTSAVDPATKSTMLARGIATAMNTTAYGLFSAVTILFCYAILNARAEKIAKETEYYVLKFINFLSLRY